jgi:4-carboxymuconolactone decarboxylase
MGASVQPLQLRAGLDRPALPGRIGVQRMKMSSLKTIGLLVVMIGVGAGGYMLGSLAQVHSAAAASASEGASSALPADVYPATGNRFPKVNREALDETTQRFYDTRPDGYGPEMIRFYSPIVAQSMTGINDFLRHKSGLEPRFVELTILATAREMDCEYVWTAHEGAARKAGLDAGVIDAVKYRKPLTGLPDKEAAVIELVREDFQAHKVSSEAFARASSLFPRERLVDLLTLMGDYASTALLLNAADQHVRPTAKPLLPLP